MEQMEEGEQKVASKIVKAASLGGALKVNRENMHLYGMSGNGLSSKERRNLYLSKKGLPRGLTEVEAEVWKEVRSNGDVDVPSNVITDLQELGYSQVEIRRAIISLLRRGCIEKSGETFEGEEVLEVP